MREALSEDGVAEHAAERLSRRLRAASVESLALGAGGLAFVAVCVIAFFVFAGHNLSISGAGSVGQFAAIACCAVTLVVYGGGRVATWSIPWYSRPKEHRSRIGAVVEVFDSIAIAVAHAVVFDESTKPSQRPRLAMRTYPAGFAAVSDPTLRTPYTHNIGWADRVWTVRQAAELGRFDGVKTVWLIENDVDGDLHSYGLADLEALGFEKTGRSVPTHRTMLIELTR